MSGAAVLPQQHFIPSSDIVTSIVLPTIFFCIGMVVVMLIGINKCKQWELDKIVEMRRTRRVIQRITARLREKNFRTIQKARNLRKRAKRNVVATADPVVPTNVTTQITTCTVKGVLFKDNKNDTIQQTNAPPIYSINQGFLPAVGTSPPPTYEDSLLDQLYYECCSTANSTQINRKKSDIRIRKGFRRQSTSSASSNGIKPTTRTQ